MFAKKLAVEASHTERLGGSNGPRGLGWLAQRAVPVLGMVVMVAGCGAGVTRPPGGTNANVQSCDTNTGGLHSCFEWSYSGTPVADSYTTACKAQNGTIGKACPAECAGACTVTSASGSITVTVTTYFYNNQTPSSVMMACSLSKGTYVAGSGCGGDMAGGNNNPDLSGGGKLPDMAMGGGNGMGQSGDACTANGDCAPSLAGASKAPQCLKLDGTSKLTYPGGYCTSPCNPSHSDMATGLNSDCPSSNATCELTSQTTGRCVALCQQASTDCRINEGYVCLNNTPYAASCSPKGPNWCDPLLPKSCPKALDGNSQLCTDFSPDQSAGECTELCDIFKQDCPVVPGTQVQEDCLADPNGVNPATCISPSGSGTLGGACRYLNDCSAGYACHAKKGGSAMCSPYCRVNAGGGLADVKCPANWTCVDLKTGAAANVITTGICQM